MERRTFGTGLAASLAVGLAGCLSELSAYAREERSEQRTYDVADGTRLAVRNTNGSVDVAGHDGDAVEVDAEIRGPSSEAVDAVSLTEQRADDELRIGTEYDDPERRASVELTIRCPDGVPVGAVKTNNGSVEVRDAAGDPTLESDNGSVTARNVDGTVSLATDNGSVTARQIGILAGATTKDGSIEIDVPTIDDDVTIESSNGSIDAALATDLDATVSATTGNGSVEHHGPELDGATTSRTSVSGTLGGGTHDLTIETSNGSIDLRAL